MSYCRKVLGFPRRKVELDQSDTFLTYEELTPPTSEGAAAARSRTTFAAALMMYAPAGR
jgi:hypothetical protein